MRWIVRIAGGLVAVAALLLVVGFVLPGTYRIERSVVIHAPPEKIYPLVAAPKRWREWSIWNRRDPAMAMSFFGPESGAGAGWQWDSKTEGKGRMTFVTADTAKGFTYELFFPDAGSTPIGDSRLAPRSGTTRVTWTTPAASAAIRCRTA